MIECGGKEERHINVQVEIELAKPLLRGTKLKSKQRKTCIEFKYEQLPIFCYYCGRMGHNEQMCSIRKRDVENNYVLTEQFGGWLRAGGKRNEWRGSRGGRGDEKDVASDRRGLATISRDNSIVQGEGAESGREMMISVPGGKESELMRTEIMQRVCIWELRKMRGKIKRI